jgi:ComF family protein
VQGVLAGVADLIFPPRCLLCSALLAERLPIPFCAPCRTGIRFIGSPLCPRCGIPFPAPEGEDHLCGECLTRERPYAIARAMAYYQGSLLESIHRFKYRGQTGIGEVLGGLLADFARDLWDMRSFTLLVPVPLHRRRLRSRGFNQAVILAREVANRFSIPLALMTLRRVVFTPPQVSLGREERLANVRGAFAVSRPERVAGQRVLLVDDVYTTGGTLAECARTLLAAGADSVALLTLARAVHDGGPGAGAAVEPDLE